MEVISSLTVVTTAPDDVKQLSWQLILWTMQAAKNARGEPWTVRATDNEGSILFEAVKLETVCSPSKFICDVVDYMVRDHMTENQAVLTAMRNEE